MSLKKFPMGDSPVVVSPRLKLSSELNLDAVKVGLSAALSRTVLHQPAAVRLQDATFRFDGETLDISVDLSPTMVDMLFGGEVQNLLQDALTKRGHGNIRVRVRAKSDLTDPKGAALESSSTPLRRLALGAAKLNEVSDKLTAQIEQIEAALKRLNLGVEAWVAVLDREDEGGNCAREEIGYTRIGNRWGVALRAVSGVRGEYGEETFSAFADSPRQQRIRAVPYVSALLEKLSAEAEAMIEKLTPKVEEISALATSFENLNEVHTGVDASKTIRNTTAREGRK